ncbi:hypothetical protein NZD89_09065 [Alicyclobacillus fastidiosus]|uniref:Uncharacterized protein n=1 Tax=Alicyclobacillus fastidiosus TaxID=392011 RepID=A0ABY6ZN23_9BACL|nr:hypothetical protein [Alicyclobacillus fastidiosus]WAH43511.1 hypothetical protein NZD89_09065 [Alicyclobacillus fastidiosus]GMA59672.1 hypothetical protein GCM10025859_01120 [Alicyclobacillus fastidiosus]
MGFMKMIIYDSIRSARPAARERTKESANPFPHTGLKQLGKTAVTKSDVDRLADKEEQTRSDVHKGIGDLYRMHSTNDEFLFKQMDRLHDAIDKHGQTIKELVDVIKNMGGLG